MDATDPTEAQAPDPRPSLAKNVALLAGSQAITAILGLGLTLIQPRLLGPVAQGQLRLAASIWTIAEVAIGLGTSLFLTVETARKPEFSRILLRRAIEIRMIGYIIAVPLVLGLVAVVGYDFDVTVLILLSGLSTLGMLVTNAARSVLSGRQQMRAISQYDVVTKVLVVTASVTVLALGFRARAISSVAVLSAFIGAVWLVRAVRRSSPPLTVDVTRRYILRGGMVFLVTEIAVVVYFQVDTFIVSLLTDDRTLGWYAAADTLVASLLFVPTIVLTALFPEIARLHDQDPEKVGVLLRQSFLFLVLVGVLMGTGTILVADPLVLLLYGKEFAETGPVLAVMGVVAFLAYLTIVLGRFALATGRGAFWNKLLIAGAVMTIPLDIVLVPWTRDRFGNGSIGGALAYVVTELMMVVAGVIHLDRGLLDRDAVTRYIKSAVAGASLLGSAWWLRDRFVLVPATVGTFTFIIVTLALRTPNSFERSIIRRAVTRIRTRLAG